MDVLLKTPRSTVCSFKVEERERVWTLKQKVRQILRLAACDLNLVFEGCELSDTTVLHNVFLALELHGSMLVVVPELSDQCQSSFTSVCKSECSLRVSVSIPSGEIITLRCREGQKVRGIKLTIQDYVGIPARLQCFFSDDTELNDTAALNCSLSVLLEQRQSGSSCSPESSSSHSPRMHLPNFELPSHFAPALSLPKAAFQGCREELPLECNGDPRSYYIEMDYIWKLLEDEIIILIRGRWLLDWSRTDILQPLPCCQDLPVDAKVDVETLRCAVVAMGEKCQYMNSARSIIAISHCWLSPHHPDPNGNLLKELAPAIEAYISNLRNFSVPPNFDGAFFFAWCSLYQPYHARQIGNTYMRLSDPQLSDLQKTRHQAALQNMDIWYTHAQTEVWMLTTLFDGQGRDYKERGWTTWERTVADLLSGSWYVLDLGKLDLGRVRQRSYHAMNDIRRMCRHARRPPVIPAVFDQLIEGKHFTCGQMDRPLIKANYRRNFGHALSCMVEGDFSHMTGWSGEDFVSLFKILWQCCNLKLLHLQYNHLGDVGVCALADCIQNHTHLVTVRLAGNRIGDAGIQAFAAILCHCTLLNSLYLEDNQICDAGAQALGEGLQHCGQLITLELHNNWIGDIGAQALSAGLQNCRNLITLSLAWNQIGDAGAQALGDVLQHCSVLPEVGLACNNISYTGVRSLGKALGDRVFGLHEQMVVDEQVRVEEETSTMVDLVVSGAGDCMVNGAYAYQCEIKGGRPVWAKMDDPNYKIQWSVVSGIWMIDCIGGNPAPYCAPGRTDLTVPLDAQWASYQRGAPPMPTVSAHGASAAASAAESKTSDSNWWQSSQPAWWKGGRCEWNKRGEPETWWHSQDSWSTWQRSTQPWTEIHWRNV